MDTPPDAVLTYLSAFSDTLSLAAVGFARRYRLPLATIHHDDVRCFAKNPEDGSRAHKRYEWILRNSRKALFASPALAACYRLKQETVTVLPPIPEGWNSPATWQPIRAAATRIYYAGAIWPAQFALLARISRALDAAGARLVVLSKETPELRAFLDAESMEWVKPFASNREALNHLAHRASGLVVSYADAVGEMPWIESSFPSKFIEYSHLGLPCAIVSPAESAIGRWAAQESYPDFFLPCQMEALTHWAESLKSAEGWKASAAPLAAHARGMFNPDAIQRQLEEILLN
ncbi:MAG: hypothetical protein PHC88_07900 [Terrimicrobiaceae bacterium]|nr:hypothetical protein [Terrimicrobiaceae bacterium]